MQLNSSLAAVLGGQFLLEESAVPAFMLQSARLLTEGGPTVPRPTDQPAPMAHFAIDMAATSLELRGYTSLDEVPAGSVAITTVSGVMMPDDSYDWEYGYVAGTRTLASRIQQADAHPNIAAHVIIGRTPGGSTMGLEHFGNVIAGTTKPMIAYVEMMCSAGVWALSGADHIIIARTGIAGSIGTKWDTLDYSKFYEKMGISVVSWTATDSVDKNRAFDEAIKGKPAQLRSQLLDPLNNEFLATVATNLPGATDDTKTGKVYVGQAAVDNGLANELGSLQDAIQLAFDLGTQGGPVAADTTASLSSFSPSSSSPSITSKIMSLFGKGKTPTAALTAVLALAGKPTIATADADAANAELRGAGITSAAIITEANYTALFDKAGRVDAAEQKVTELNATVGTLTTAKTDLEGKLAASEAEVTRLGALGGAEPTGSNKPAGDLVAPGAKASYFDPNAQHNKDAEALLG